MRLDHLVLRNFRNYVDCEVDFPNRVNLIIGGNAQGKTSLLEAIYFLSTAKSHRTYPDNELIRHNEDWFYLKGIIACSDKDDSCTDPDEIGIQSDLMTLEVSNQLNGRKRFKLNSHLQKKLSQWIGQFKVVFFSPESLTLVKGSPADRRRFIDILLFQISSTYLKHLQNYQLVLKQRNELLKQIRSKQANVKLLEAWDTLLVEDGVAIIQARSETLGQLKVHAQAKHAELTGDCEKLELIYQPPAILTGIDSVSRSEAVEQFRKALNTSRDNDILRGTTSAGPHRDDFKLVLETQWEGTILREEAKPFSSQGQQRTIALALKLAELEVMRQTTHKTPIVLLDDVLSELDEVRSTFLLELLQDLNAQTFITSTHLDVWMREVKDCRVLTVKNGQID